MHAAILDRSLNALAALRKHIAFSAELRNQVAEQSRLSETAASELKQIVDYRNEAAHGDVDDVLGPEILIEFTHFFEALYQSLLDFIQYDTLRRARDIGRATVVGVITEQFRGDVVVAKVSNANLAVGDQLYVFKKGMTMAVQMSPSMSAWMIARIMTSNAVMVALAAC